MALTRPKIKDIDTSIIGLTDPITVLHQGATSANADVGFLFNRANGLVSNVALYWSESAQSLVTAYTSDSGVGNSNVSVTSHANVTIGNLLMVNGSILNVTGNIHANIVGNLYGSVESTGNLSTSANISAAGFYWANGTPFISSSYGNLEVSYYLPLYTGTLGNVTTSNIVVINNSTISTSIDTGALQVSGGVGIAGSLYIANTGDVSANIGSYQNWANANVAGLYDSILGANAAIVTANNAVVSYVDTLNAAMASNVAGANAAIVTANNAVVSYVDTLNAAMASNVAGANAAIVAANSAVVSYVDTLNAAMASNVAGANAAIVTANTELKGYVDNQITNLVGGAPAILDTLNEIATSLGNNASLSTTLLSAIAGANAAIVTANADMKTYVDAANTIQSNQIVTLQSQVYANANVSAYLPTYSGSLGGTLTTASQPNITSVGTLTGLTSSGVVQVTNSTNNTGLAFNNGALQVTGGVGIGGNLYVGGNVIVAANVYSSTGNITVANITGTSGQFFGNSAGFGALYTGIPSGYVYQAQTVIQTSSNFDDYAQINHQNINSGANASTDYVATADNGTADDTYIDFGINSSGFAATATQGPNDGYLYIHGNTTTGGGNLLLASVHNDIVFATNGTEISDVVEYGRITDSSVFDIKSSVASTSNVTGAITVAGGVGIAGNLNVGGNIFSAGARTLTAADLEVVTYTANSITKHATYGTYNSGDVTSITTMGDYGTGGYYSVNDSATSPGFIVYVDFVGVTDFNRVLLNLNYTQNSGHVVDIDIYNNTTSSWDTLAVYSGTTGYYQFTLSTIDSTPYLNAGVANVRIYHASFGNVSHETRIDYVALQKSITGGQGPRGPTGATGATGPQGPSWAGGYVANVTTFGSNLVANSGTASTSTTTGAVVVQGGVGIAGSLYIANTGDVSANIGGYQSWANANVAGLYNSIQGANAVIITANSAVVSYVDTLNAAMASNVAGANAAIVTANTALKNYADNQITSANNAVVSYVDTLNTAMISNINAANAAIVTANTAMKGYVDNQITTLIGGAPAALDTLYEISNSLGNNASLSTTLLNSIAGSNAAIVTANNAVVSYVDTLNAAMASNVAGANAAIVTANTALKAYVDDRDTTITTAWTANAATQQDLITTLQSQVYANSNVASYLPTYTGNINAGNITANTAGTTTTVANLVTTNGVFWANGTAYSGGTGITYTASATAPTSPHVGDQWYYTTGDILYEYQDVGTGTFWIDITSPIITSGNVTSPGSDILSPFLLMGA